MVVKSMEARTPQWASRKAFQVDCRFRSGAGSDAVRFQDIADRPVEYGMSKVGQGPLDAVIAPCRTVLGHGQDQFNDLAWDRRASG